MNSAWLSLMALPGTPSAASTDSTSPSIGATIVIAAIRSCWRRISTCCAAIAASDT